MKTISQYELETMYEDMLDDVYGVVDVAGMQYDTSRLLKEADPIAYAVGMHDYADSLMSDGYEVEGYN
jgi:hypothetical protein